MGVTMSVGLTMVERKAVTKETVAGYQRASKKRKGRILDELCALTGWNRDHARRALRQAAGPAKPRQPRRQALVYGPELTAPLRKVWATLNGPCGKRLAPFMAEIVGLLERFGELELGPRERELLLSVSAAIIDRRLKGARRGLQLKGRSGTKPGAMLKHQIAIRTFSRVGRGPPGVPRDRPGGPRGREPFRGLLPEPGHDRCGHGLDGGTRGQEEGPAVGLRGPAGRRGRPSVPARRHRLG